MVLVGNTNAHNFLVAFPANAATHSKKIKPTTTKFEQIRKQSQTTNFFQKITFKLKIFIKNVKNYVQYLKANGGVNVFALIGFIAAILGFLLLLVTGFPFLMGTLGLIFGIIGLSQINKGNGTGRGFAITAIILGGLIILLAWIVILIIGIALLAV